MYFFIVSQTCALLPVKWFVIVKYKELERYFFKDVPAAVKNILMPFTRIKMILSLHEKYKLVLLLTH